MNFEVKYRFTQDWIPPRCRKPRPGKFDGAVTVDVREVNAEKAPWACVVHGFRRYFDEYPYNALRYCDGRFYERAMREPHIEREFSAIDSYGDPYWWKSYDDAQNVSRKRYGMSVGDMVSDVRRYPYYWESASESEIVSRILDEAGKYLVVNGEVWTEVGEPMYEINTFGLGHNHGGTSWFVQHGYNSNISKDRYFNANDFEAMVDKFFSIALGRGDTDSAHSTAVELASGNVWNHIEVILPEAFMHDPQVEHGDGDEFMNMIDVITSSADSALEAGLLTMMAALA